MVSSKSLNKHICTYKNCNAIFKRPYRLQAHINAKHKFSKPFNCKYELCEKSFYRKEHLRRHITKVHEISITHTLTCPDCHFTFTLPQNFKRHKGRCSKIKNSVGYHNRYGCEYCAKFFKKKEAYKKHVFFHTGLKPYYCPIKGCFHHKNAQEIQILSNKVIPFSEEALPVYNPRSLSGFMTHQKMKRHMNLHESDETLVKKVFNCPFPVSDCLVWQRKSKLMLKKFRSTIKDFDTIHVGPVEFKSQNLLSQHIKIHHGYLYKCDYCQKTFITKRGLTRHSKQSGSENMGNRCSTSVDYSPKTGSQFFECPNAGCNKYYLHKRNLNYHLKKNCKFVIASSDTHNL